MAKTDERPTGWAIQAALATWHEHRKALAAADQDQIDAESELLDRTGAEPEATEEAILTILDSLLRDSLHAADMAKAAVERAKLIAARATRFDARCDQDRALALAIMTIIGRKRHVMPELTASIRKGTRQVVVADEAEVDGCFKETIPASIRIDRRKLLAALIEAEETGEIISGATLNNAPPGLTVTVK